MSTITHMRCDRCDKDVLYDSRGTYLRQSGWMQCHVDFDTLDFCPSCWDEIMRLAKMERVE
jgi:hypothetical protein